MMQIQGIVKEQNDTYVGENNGSDEYSDNWDDYDDEHEVNNDYRM